MATKEREEIKGTTKQKMARRHNMEEGNHLKQESNRQRTMEDIDGGLHPAVDGQSLGESIDTGQVNPSTDPVTQGVRQGKLLVSQLLIHWYVSTKAVGWALNTNN